MISKKYRGISDSEEEFKRPPKLVTNFETDIEKKGFKNKLKNSKRPDLSGKGRPSDYESENYERLETVYAQFAEISYTAEQYDLNALTKSLDQNPMPGLTLVKKTQLFLSFNYKPDVLIIIFQFGTFAVWNSDAKIMDFVLNLVSPYTISPYEKSTIETDDMKYCVKPNKSKLECHQHRFILQNDTNELKVTVSYAWSQSVALDYFTKRLKPLINQAKGLAVDIKNSEPDRNVFKSKKQIEINVLIGKLWGLKCSVNLSSNILDEMDPVEIFQCDTSEDYWCVQYYYCLEERTQILNNKIQVVTDMAEKIREVRWTFNLIG